MEIIILLTVLIGSGLLGLAVFYNNPKSLTNILFFILSCLIAVWSIVIYLSQHPQSLDATIIWVRLTTFFAVPMVVAFLLLAVYIPNAKIRLSPTRKALLILL